MAAAADASVAPTELLYFADTYCLEAEARVVAVAPSDDAAHAGDPAHLTLLLDRTVFYPAGGGQPADGGEVRCGSAVLTVSDVRLKDGIVRHSGVVSPTSAAAAFAPGATATLRVDGARRELHARVHSAGHLLDVCLARCGYPPSVLSPTKGLHGASDAYVEYAGKVPPEDCGPLAERLNASLAAAVTQGGRTRSEILSYDAAAKACHVTALPPYIAADATPRVVTVVEGEPGCPCGGTHVDDVARLGAVTVTGVRVKKGTTRISYRLDGMA